MPHPDTERVNARFENTQPISVGRIVHFPLKADSLNPYGDTQEVVPALVVRAWNSNCLNLQVFYDGTNSDRQRDSDEIKHDIVPHMISWRTSVTYDAGEDRVIDGRTVRIYNPHTWHWPPRS